MHKRWLFLPFIMACAMPAQAETINGMLMGNDKNLVFQACLSGREDPVLLKTETNRRNWSNLVDTNLAVGLPAINDQRLAAKYLENNMVRLNVTARGDMSLGHVSGPGGRMYHGSFKLEDILIAGPSRGFKRSCNG